MRHFVWFSENIPKKKAFISHGITREAKKSLNLKGQEKSISGYISFYLCFVTLKKWFIVGS